MYNVYLYGMISPSTVYVLDDKFMYPEANGYAEIKKEYPSIGGEAINSAFVLSRLGLNVKFDGCFINSKYIDKINTILKPYNIDTSSLTVKDDCGTVEIVITDKETRTVFGNYAAYHSGDKQWNSASEFDIQNAEIVGLDPYFRNDAESAAKLCVKNNKKYVTLDAGYDDYIAKNAEVIVISHELRDRIYVNQNMKDVFLKYQQNCKGLIIFTFGSDDLWYARPNEEPKYFKPYKITPVDTTGAGDSFRGAIIYGVYKGMNDYEIVRFASAVAACVCLTIPHALNAPDLSEVIKFIEDIPN